MIAKTSKQTENTKIINDNSAAANAEGTVEVLYQKMGDRWFAFSVVDEEVFVGSISAETIRTLEKKTLQGGKKVGNT